LFVLYHPNLTPPHEPNLVNLKFDEQGKKELTHKGLPILLSVPFYALPQNIA
jgi:hypothetical protein